jgi:hypothetical protein
MHDIFHHVTLQRQKPWKFLTNFDHIKFNLQKISVCTQIGIWK